MRGIHRWPVDCPLQRASNGENVSIWWRHHVAENVFTCNLVKRTLYILILIEFCFQWWNWQVRSCPGNDLAPSRRHAITGNNDDPKLWRHMASLGPKLSYTIYIIILALCAWTWTLWICPLVLTTKTTNYLLNTYSLAHWTLIWDGMGASSITL